MLPSSMKFLYRTTFFREVVLEKAPLRDEQQIEIAVLSMKIHGQIWLLRKAC